MFDTLIKDADVYTKNGLESVDLGIKDGKIIELGKLNAYKADKILSYKGLSVFPGFIDSQVHFREPGFPAKETIESGSRSAVLGGITGFMEMPNTKPATTSIELLLDKLKIASEKSYANYAFFFGATAENFDLIPDAERIEGFAGVKIFMGSSTGDLLIDEEANLRKILQKSTRRVAVHAEDNHLLEAKRHLATNVSQHHIWRDEEVALTATKKITYIAEELRKKVHILHITSKQELEFLSTHKDYITIEATPNHLVFSSDDYEKYGTRIQMNPPIRDLTHKFALLKALRNGLVDVVGSDHAPHTIAEKNQTYPNTPSGIPGVETIAPLLINLMLKGHLSMPRLVDLLSSGVARIYSLKNKGHIAVGFDADFTILDLSAKYTVKTHYLCGWSPFDGMKLNGKVVSTIVGGNLVMSEGECFYHKAKPIVGI